MSDDPNSPPKNDPSASRRKAFQKWIKECPKRHAEFFARLEALPPITDPEQIARIRQMCKERGIEL